MHILIGAAMAIWRVLNNAVSMRVILLFDFFMATHATVQRSAVKPEQSGSFAYVTSRKLQSCTNKGGLLLTKVLVQIEVAST